MKPYIILDLETTGVDPLKDRIVEICVIKYNADGVKEVRTRLVNPTIPIPKSASDVHGIADDKVKDAPTFKTIAKGLHEYIKGCDIVGYYSNNFDVPVLITEFERAGISFDVSDINLVDVYKMYAHFNPRTLVAAYKDLTGKELEGAHGASADCLATDEVLQGLIRKFDLNKDFTELSKIGNDSNKVDPFGKLIRLESGEIALAFGKNKGIALKQVEKSYFD